MQRIRENPRLILWLILGVALVVRLLGIASRPIWYDEAFSILFSEKGPLAMLHGTLATTGSGAADIHPLTYYTLLWLWMRIFGESLISVRVPGILVGLATIFCLHELILELVDERTALMAALLLALSPFHIHYSQEIRMYALLALWLILAAYAYTKAMKTGRKSWWAVFAVSAALAQYTHNLAAFFLISLALYPALRRDFQTLKRVIVSGLAALLLYLPWLVNLLSQFAKVENAYWIERPDLSRFFTLLLTFVTNLPLPDNWLLPGLFIAMTITVLGFLQTARHKSEAGLWLAYLSFAPPILLFLFSQWKPVYLERALLASGVLYCGWIAWVLSKTGLPGPIRFGAGGLLLIGLLVGIVYHITYSDFPYVSPEVPAFIARQIEPEDVIVHSNKLSLLPAMYYARSLHQEFIGDPPGSGTDTLARATQDVLGIEASPNIASAIGQAPRVWYVIYQRSIDEMMSQGQSTHPDLVYLGTRYQLEEQQEWNGLIMYLFIEKP